MESMDLEVLTERIIGCAIAVHRVLGPGLLESTYEACLAHELAKNGLHVLKQKEIPIRYKSVKLDCGYRVDLLVNDKVVAKGEVVVVDENFGIRIVSLVSPEERIKSLR